MTEARVLVLGHRGMLGHVVRRHLTACGFGVTTTEVRFSATSSAAFAKALENLSFDGIVNCIGLKRGSEGELFEANAELPRFLTDSYPERLLVHASSDGVFSGRGGPYSVDASPDAQDPYGRSKCAAETFLRERLAVTLRCSIVGPERGAATSLLGWLMTQSGSAAGYSDHLWNGITTLTWAKLCEAALRGNLAPGLHQPACSPAVTKAELLEHMRRYFAPALRINPTPSGHPIDRRLEPTFDSGPIDEQLQELAEWYGQPS